MSIVQAGNTHDQLPWNSKDAAQHFSFAGLAFNSFAGTVPSKIRIYLESRRFDFDACWASKGSHFIVLVSKNQSGIVVACIEGAQLAGVREWPIDPSIAVRVEASIAMEIREFLRSVKRHLNTKADR